ncbi:Beta propeller domain protein [Planococcus massiliensis]|uniref:Beta propeller domain protein n=1 Tax=Planococcus massiliensis TaxID=1499687 RepID=A0A098EHP1_9BACL|nr:beta-propeller domain-containing protein [Planococcus massiliensis]CEG21829.1 Beta propeller domain protein [Planococcus massiliensis]
MKKRSLWLIAAAALAMIGLTVAFMMDKVTVSASSIALADQGWKANFSSPLKPDAIEKGDLYLINASGEPVDAEMTLLKNGKTIEIPLLAPGEYKLHIKKAAVKGSLLKSLALSEVSFVVQEELETLSNADELKAYFARLLDLQQQSDGSMAVSGSADSMASEESSSADAAGGEGGDFSSTNNQVEGVDEADLVKTDGSFIYSISDSSVVISDVRNPAEMNVAAKLLFKQDMYPQQLFLSGNTLVVLGSQYSVLPTEGKINDYQRHVGLTSVYLYDIQNPSSPQLIREFGTEGDLNGARLTEKMLYFVTNVYPDYWMMESQKDPELRPHHYDSQKNEDLQPMPYDNLSILPGTMEGRYSVITAIDLTNPTENSISTDGYLGGSEQMYMNAENLYITASVYMPIDEAEEDNDLDMSVWQPQSANTEIFKFHLEGDGVKFVASNEVAGTLLNQFSMDEYNGYFRVVTTEGFTWDEAAPSKNHLFVLDGGMKQIGSVEDLAQGERIYSARFMGDKAYMVTFKETDPLFVIDVSAPSSPKVLGELKIPGFSNYLHPLDENHLIGFGYDTKLEPVKGGEPRVVTGGMKISLFDVSDFSNPLEKDAEIIGGPGTYSPLQYDHKALFTHKESNLYGFPVAEYAEGENDSILFQGSGAMLFEITPDGIEKAADLMKEASMQYEDWEKSVQRILYIEDRLYTVANSEISSYGLADFNLIQTLSYK